MKNKKGKKSEGASLLGEGGIRRTKDSALSSHHLPREKSEEPSPLGERGARRAEDRSLSSHHFSQQ